MRRKHENNIYQFDNKQNLENDYSADILDENQEKADADIKKLYQQAAGIDVPDLWNRIENGFDREMVSVRRAQRKRRIRIAGCVAAAVLAVCIAVPILNMNNRTKSDESMERTTQETMEDITEATVELQQEDCAAEEAYEDTEKVDGDAAMDAAVDTVNEEASQTANAANAEETDQDEAVGEESATGITVAHIIDSCDGQDAPEGAQISDIISVHGYRFAMGGKTDIYDAELVWSEIYSDGSLDVPTKDIRPLYKTLKLYNVLEWQGSSPETAYDGDDIYLYVLKIGTDEGVKKIYRLYTAWDSCPFGSAEDFADTFFEEND